MLLRRPPAADACEIHNNRGGWVDAPDSINHAWAGSSFRLGIALKPEIGACGARTYVLALGRGRRPAPATGVTLYVRWGELDD